jgi:hypothetical protein
MSKLPGGGWPPAWRCGRLDAFALSKSLGREVSVGRIIHGDDHATLKMKRDDDPKPRISWLETAERIEADLGEEKPVSRRSIKSHAGGYGSC